MLKLTDEINDELAQYLRSKGLKVTWDFDRRKREYWYEVYYDDKLCIQIEPIGVPLKDFLEDVVLLAQNKKGTSPTDFFIRGSDEGFNKVVELLEVARMSRKKALKIEPHPRLQEVFSRRREIKKQLDKIDDEVDEIVLELVLLNQDKLITKEPYRIVNCELGSWECPGPLGICVYDGEWDPQLEGCLFCGEPNDRP